MGQGCCTVEKIEDRTAVVVDDRACGHVTPDQVVNPELSSEFASKETLAMSHGMTASTTATKDTSASRSSMASVEGGGSKYIEKQFAEGGSYAGQMKSGLRHGRGKFVYPDGVSVYEGQWRQDRCEGWGRFKDDESEYEGTWNADKKHGKGKETWFDDKSNFSGDYVRGMKHGTGVYKWADGSRYEGEFDHDIIQGKGVYKSLKSIYNGQFHNSMQHGSGIQKWTDGRVYDGQFKENHRDGKGKMIWTDGHTYDGQWRQGQQHGSGQEGKRGNFHAVVYVHGKRQGGKKADKANDNSHPIASPVTAA